MKKELREKLIKALKNAGIDEGLADAMSDQSEEAVEKFINGLKPKEPSIEEILGSEAFEKYIADGGFDKLLTVSKKAQSEFDRKTTKALNTFKQNLLGRKTEEDDDSDDDFSAGSQGAENSGLKKLIAQLSEKIDRLESRQTAESKREQAMGLLKKSKLPQSVHEKWLSRIDLSGDMSEQISNLETEYKELVGDVGDDGNVRFDMTKGSRDSKKLSGSEEKALREAAAKL